MKIYIIFLIFICLSFPNLAQISNPRAWAEYEEARGIIINQPYKWGGMTPDKPDWFRKDAEEFDSLYIKLINEALYQNIDIYYLLDTTSSYSLFDPVVLDTMVYRYGIDINNPKFHIIRYDEKIIHPNIWVRDNGPMNVYEDKVGALHEILFAHSISGTGKIVSQYLGIPTIEISDASTDNSSTMGGNYMVDGNSMAIIDEGAPSNKSQLPNYSSLFGLDHIYTIPNYMEHIDMYMKLVNEETLLISVQDPWNYTTGLEQYDYGEDSYHLNEAVLYIQQNVISQYGMPLKIYRVLNAPSFDSLDIVLSYSTANATYTNSLILNNTVFVPQFSSPQSDTEALKVYKRAMPGYKIIPVQCRQLAMYSGAFHCITNSIATDEPIWIRHAWFPETLNQTSDYRITASILTRSGVKSAKLFYRFDINEPYKYVYMVNSSKDDFVGYIPGQLYGTRVYYYFEVEANSGKKSNKPLVAPNWAYNFLIDPEGTNLSEVVYSNSDFMVNVYPEITTNRINFDFQNFPGQTFEIEIYDLWGRMLKKETASSNIEFNTSSFAPGCYLFVIKDTKSGQYKTGKFIK
jgi:agmatine deiminase